MDPTAALEMDLSQNPLLGSKIDSGRQTFTSRRLTYVQKVPVELLRSWLSMLSVELHKIKLDNCPRDHDPVLCLVRTLFGEKRGEVKQLYRGWSLAG